MAAPLKMMNTSTTAICIALIMVMSCALSCSGEGTHPARVYNSMLK